MNNAATNSYSILLIGLIGSFSLINAPSHAKKAESKYLAKIKSINFSYSILGINTYRYGVIEAYMCVPKQIFVYDDAIEGDYQASYSAAVEYGMMYASNYLIISNDF